LREKQREKKVCFQLEKKRLTVSSPDFEKKLEEKKKSGWTMNALPKKEKKKRKEFILTRISSLFSN